jgi:hypothetical protein
MTAHLMYLRVLPAAAKDIRTTRARDVAWDLHATDKISSRTRWRRIRSGRGRSKKKAAVASRTFVRNSSQVLPSVKMFSVRHSAQYPPSDSWTTSNTSSAIRPSYGANIGRAPALFPAPNLPDCFAATIKTSVARFVRLHDFVWLLLCSALAYVSPNRDPLEIRILLAIAALQILEPKIPFFTTPKGNVASILLKLVLSYVLIGSTGGVTSRYYLILLLPLLSAATTLGQWGSIFFTLVCCGAYFSFTLPFFMDPTRYEFDREGQSELFLHVHRIRRLCGLVAATRWLDELLKVGQDTFTDREYDRLLCFVELSHPEHSAAAAMRITPGRMAIATSDVRQFGLGLWGVPGGFLETF